MNVDTTSSPPGAGLRERGRETRGREDGPSLRKRWTVTLYCPTSTTVPGGRVPAGTEVAGGAAAAWGGAAGGGARKGGLVTGAYGCVGGAGNGRE